MVRKKTYVERYYTGTILSDRIHHSQAGPKSKAGRNDTVYYFPFLFHNFTGYVAAAVFLVIVIRLSGVPFRYMVKGMKAIVFLLLLTMVFNLFLTPGETLVQFWKLTITKEGLRIAIFMAIRLTFLIIGSSLMTLTTTPNNLTDGMEKLMSPLKRVRVPVHEIAMMMSIALRFIPILMEETDKIMKAQIARGRILRVAT